MQVPIALLLDAGADRSLLNSEGVPALQPQHSSLECLSVLLWINTQGA